MNLKLTTRQFLLNSMEHVQTPIPLVQEKQLSTWPSCGFKHPTESILFCRISYLRNQNSFLVSKFGLGCPNNIAQQIFQNGRIQQETPYRIEIHKHPDSVAFRKEIPILQGLRSVLPSLCFLSWNSQNSIIQKILKMSFVRERRRCDFLPLRRREQEILFISPFLLQM